MPPPTVTPHSSRTSAAAAGWTECGGPGRWKSDVPVGTKSLSWLRPATLWQSRNDIIARSRLFGGDPTPGTRAVWIKQARARALATGASEDFTFALGGPEHVSLLVLGDPGEGDDSQYAVVPSLLSQADGIDAAIICSDVIYPTGDIGDYRDKFYRPYRDLHAPILALPGNHDWYDGLHGFMYHLCGLEIPTKPPPGRSVGALLRRILWRTSPGTTPLDLEHMRRARAAPDQLLDPPQPAPYFCFDAGPLRFVAIDTGILGTIDAEQGQWLARVSRADPRPKVLLTGKPPYVDGVSKPGGIDGGTTTVDDIVRDPAANYVAAIGGDIHNYQRYPIKLPDGRTIQYIVSGGGGAFMHATHQIPKVELPGVSEHDFKCYPLRGDSLARYSQLYDERLTGDRGLLRLSPKEASSYMADLLGLDPTRAGHRVKLGLRAKLAAHFIQPLPAASGFHKFVSEAFDWDAPPLFKSFLRLDAEPGALHVRCFGVSGCAGSEDDPPVEDHFTIAL